MKPAAIIVRTIISVVPGNEVSRSISLANPPAEPGAGGRTTIPCKSPLTINGAVTNGIGVFGSTAAASAPPASRRST
jgi:hypothetical protein